MAAIANFKVKSWRNQDYLKWVRTQPCVLCRAPADDSHHIIGTGNLGGMGTKAPDQFSIPTCRGCHTKIHTTPEIWQAQWEWVAKTMAKAVSEGVLKCGN